MTIEELTKCHICDQSLVPDAVLNELERFPMSLSPSFITKIPCCFGRRAERTHVSHACHRVRSRGIDDRRGRVQGLWRNYWGRDLETVESCDNQLDFAGAVEKVRAVSGGKCCSGTLRGNASAPGGNRSTSNRLHRKRQREGASYRDALSEFMELDPPSAA
jgi:hypothetical protein